MSIPQDGRSPVQQGRWIECYNSGAVDIPAHGVCEVAGNTVNSTEFRTYLSVRRPTAYGLPNIVVNGPVPIPVGKYGWCTLDFPAFALGAAGLVNGDMAGTVTDSFAVAKGYPGVLVLGTGPVTDSYRVSYLWEPLIRGSLGAELCPDAATATIATSYVSANSLGITSALNTYALAGPYGAEIAMQWDGLEEEWIVLQVQHRVVKLLTDIDGDPDNCKITQDYIQKTALMYCGSQATEDAVQFYSTDVVSDVRASGTGSNPTSCKIQAEVKTICTLNNPTGTWTDKINLVDEVVLQDIWVDGLCIKGYVNTVWVICSGTAEIVTLDCGTECSSS